MMLRTAALFSMFVKSIKPMLVIQYMDRQRTGSRAVFVRAECGLGRAGGVESGLVTRGSAFTCLARGILNFAVNSSLTIFFLPPPLPLPSLGDCSQATEWTAGVCKSRDT